MSAMSAMSMAASSMARSAPLAHPLGPGQRRQLVATGMLLLLLPLVTLVLRLTSDHLTLAAQLLVYVAVVVTITAVGGAAVGFCTAILTFLAANFFFIEPRHTFSVADSENVVALLVFLAVTATVSVLVSIASYRAVEAHRSRTEAEALEASAALRTALLRAVSHDLRTPLTSIKTSVSSLLAADVTWTDEERREFLTVIDGEAGRLDRLIGNLLDMGRLQTGGVRVDLRATYVEDVVEAAVSSISGLDASRVDVESAGDVPPVRTDPALLERAIANLVSNALKASPPQREVIVRPEVVVPGAVDVHVIDHGAGIPAELRQLAMEPFRRLDSGHHPDGIGLGLSITDGLAKAIGGELHLGDTVGGGLTATIRLPLAT